jgi:hypothetical protein
MLRGVCLFTFCILLYLFYTVLTYLYPLAAYGIQLRLPIGFGTIGIDFLPDCCRVVVEFVMTGPRSLLVRVSRSDVSSLSEMRPSSSSEACSDSASVWSSAKVKLLYFRLQKSVKQLQKSISETSVFGFNS